MSLSYKGYTAAIEYVPEDNLFWGDVDGITDAIIFSGSNVDELKKNFQESIDFYLQSCAETGDVPQRPASQNVTLRLAPRIYSAARAAAERTGQSLGEWLQALAARETGVAL